MLLKEIQADKTEVKNIAPVKRTRWVGTLRPKPGQRVFRLNTLTAVIEPAPMDVQLSVIGKKIGNIRVEPDCLYCVALNKENAEKKFIKLIEKI
jgi:hypothetical protein